MFVVWKDLKVVPGAPLKVSYEQCPLLVVKHRGLLGYTGNTAEAATVATIAIISIIAEETEQQ